MSMMMTIRTKISREYSSQKGWTSMKMRIFQRSLKLISIFQSSWVPRINLDIQRRLVKMISTTQRTTSNIFRYSSSKRRTPIAQTCKWPTITPQLLWEHPNRIPNNFKIISKNGLNIKKTQLKRIKMKTVNFTSNQLSNWFKTLVATRTLKSKNSKSSNFNHRPTSFI